MVQYRLKALFPKNFFFSLKDWNIIAVWMWKSDILKQVVNCVLPSQPFILFLVGWIVQKWSKSIQGCIIFIFLRFWMPCRVCNSIYKTTLVGNEQRRQLIILSSKWIWTITFFKAQLSEYWFLPHCKCIYMKKAETKWHKNGLLLSKSFSWGTK